MRAAPPGGAEAAGGHFPDAGRSRSSRENKVSINIHMNSDRDDADGGGLTGYEFNHSNTQEGMIITTETPDEEAWLNDGDPDSPFFHTPRSATNTEIREISGSGRTFGRPGMKKK